MNEREAESLRERVRALEQHVDELQTLAAIAVVVMVLHLATNEFGEDRVEAITWLILAGYFALLLCRAIFRWGKSRFG